MAVTAAQWPDNSDPIQVSLTPSAESGMHSFSYWRSSTTLAAHGEAYRPHRLSNRKKMKLRIQRAFKAALKGMKKVLFVFPKTRTQIKQKSASLSRCEYPSLHRSDSKSTANMNSSHSREGTSSQLQRGGPEVIVHSSSQRRSWIARGHESSSYKGKKKSVLLSHPVVTHVISAPPTLLSSVTPRDLQLPRNESGSDDTIGDDEDFGSSRPVSGSSSPATSEFAAQVNPKKMFQLSFQGGHLQGTKSDFDKLKAALDGLRLNGKGASVPSLRPLSGRKPERPSYLSRSPTISLGDTEEVRTPAEIDQNRASALEALTGAKPAQLTHSAPPKRALMDDLPVGLPSGEQLPAGTNTSTLRPKTRNNGLSFQPYTPDFNPFGNAEHSPKRVSKRQLSSSLQGTDATTPISFADIDRHKRHYSMIESGIFELGDDRIAPQQTRLQPNAHTSTLRDAHGFDPMPMRSSARSSTLHCHPTVESTLPLKRIPRKPVPNRTRTPPVSTAAPTIVLAPDSPVRSGPRASAADLASVGTSSGNIPEPIKMNENGFPIIVTKSVSVTTERASAVMKSVRQIEVERAFHGMYESPRKARSPPLRKSAKKNTSTPTMEQQMKAKKIEEAVRCIIL